jgi:hypothetical protein
MSTANVDLKALSNEFIRQIHEGSCISLTPFCENCWFAGAYSTIRRTLHTDFEPLSAENLTACRELLFLKLKQLKPDDFDAGIKELIEAVADKFGLSIGHGQKLASILLKYAFAAAKSGGAGLPNELSRLVSSTSALFPVPIDAIVLFQLKKTVGVNSDDIRAYRRPNADGEFMHTAFVNQNGSWVTWSRMTDYSTYSSLQQRIRKVAELRAMTPLVFEMSSLWVTD